MPPSSLIFSLLKMFGPSLGKPAANFAAEQLNKRRAARSGSPTSAGTNQTDSADPVPCHRPYPKPTKTKVVYRYRPSRWQYLSSLLIGAGLTVIVILFFSRR